MKENSGILGKYLFPNTHWFLLLLIPISILGFYPSYFSVLDEPHTLTIHLHAVLMMGWLGLAILQPWLIHYRKFAAHQFIGKISYLLFPLLIYTGYRVIGFSYKMAIFGERPFFVEYWPKDWTIEHVAGASIVIAGVYWIWLVVYYLLGILVRKNRFAHAHFMLAATLTVLGPAGDRLIGHICNSMGWEFNLLAENFVYMLVGLVFAALALKHYRQHRSYWPALLVLGIHVLGVLLYYTLPYSEAWVRLTTALFAPEM